MTDSERALLRALFAPEPEALANFDRWQAAIDLEQLPPTHYPLLPLLSARLESLGLAQAARLIGVRRRAWYVRQLAQQTLMIAAPILHAADFTPMIIGEAACAQVAYPSDSPRPIEIAALLVPAAQARGALLTLRDHGWQPQPLTAQLAAPAFTAWRSTCLFIGNAGRRFELRWHVLPEWPTAALDDAVWNSSRPDRATPLLRTPSPSALLLLACVTAADQSPRTLIGLADVITLLRSDQMLDWPWLIETAVQTGLMPALQAALTAASGIVRLEIPAQIWTPRRASGPRRSIELAHRPVPGWQQQVHRFRHIAQAQNRSPSPRAVWDYLQHYWGLARRREVVTHLIKRMINRR